MATDMDTQQETLLEQIKAAWMRLPVLARKGIVDFIETFVAMVVVLNLAIPGTLDEAKAQAVLVGGAALSAALSAGRRIAPEVWGYLKATFPTATLRMFVIVPLFAAGLLVAPTNVTPVAATGNCGTAYAIFYQYSAPWGGQTAKFCYGVSDKEIERAPLVPNNMGPLADGTFKSDFSPSISASGIRGVRFYDNPNDTVNANLCLYHDDAWETPGGFVKETGWWGFEGLLDPGSLLWKNGGTSANC